MKKFLSVVMILAVLLSCCACGAKNEGVDSTEPALSPQSPEAMYGHIDQTVPVDGYHKIWNAEGVKFMMENNPDGKFEILCNIDMEGATLSPIGTFTGTLKGGNFKITNFTLQGGDETDFGFITVNKGNIQNLTLENVTLIPGANAKNIGSFAGTNEGKINRCNITGAMTVEKAAADASCGALAGVNTGSMANMVCTVDVLYSAQGAAKVGGLVGTASAGTEEFLENHGKLTVTGDKAVGLFAGEASETVFTNCVFGGADNSLDGKLFTNFTGNVDDDERAVALNGKWRDNGYQEPLPENVQAIRKKVVDAMYDMCTVEWHVTEDLVHSCTCQLSACHGVYNSRYTYYGLPYNHKSSSLARFKYCLNADKTIFDWFYDLDSFDGFDIYIGTDCSSTVQQAWWTVSNSTDIRNTTYLPAAMGRGTIAVGDYTCDFELKKETRDGVNAYYTAQYLEATDEQVMYESYAATRPGDAIVNKLAAGGHTRMIAYDPVVIKDQDGKIDPTYSYVLTHEQGSTWTDDVKMEASSCKVDWKYTFAALYGDCYVPLTCEELLSGEMEPAEAKLEDSCGGYSGMFTGTVRTNYHLDSVTLKITDSKGEEVLSHPIFVTSQKNNDYGGAYFTARSYTDWFDLADFAVVLSHVPFTSGESYNYTLTADLATFEHIQVHEGNFAYGS